MSIADSVVALLKNDVGAGKFSTLMPGGVYEYSATGEVGISRDTTPSAFDGLDLKPCCVVKMRDANPDGQILDVSLSSYRQVVELWMYDDVNTTWTTIDAAAKRAFALLNEQRVGDGLLFWAGDFARGREAELGDALKLRSDYTLRAIKGA